MTERRAIMVAGPLDENDLALFTALMRSIEQKSPKEVFKAVIISLEKDPTMEDMAKMLERVFPRVHGREPVFSVEPRKK